MLKATIITLLILLLAGVGLAHWREKLNNSTPLPNNPLFQPLDNEGLKTLVNKNRLTLVNMWASWCGPCREEFPDLLKLRKNHSNDSFALIFLSVDRPEDRADANQFLLEQKVDFPTYFARDPIENTIRGITNNMWEGGVPVSYLFDSTGKQVGGWMGGGSLEQFESKILPLLAK